MRTLSSVPGAGLLIDDEYVIRDGNNRCDVIFKRDFDDIRGDSLKVLQDRRIIDDKTRKSWEDAVTAVLTGAESNVTEQITLRPNGDKFVYGLRVSVATGQQGKAYCSLRNAETIHRYDETITALHAATRGLMTAEDVETVLEQTAAAASEVLGFPGTGVRRHDGSAGILRHVSFGSSVGSIDDRPPYPVEGTPHGEAIQRGETVINEIGDTDPYDREVFTQTMYSPIGKAGLLSIGVIGRTFNETDIQFAEILTANAEAAIRVVETTNSLRKERERLDRFASVVSHDLRNPLSIAGGYLERARETGDPEDFSAAEGALNRMDRMIEDLLTMARADTEADTTEHSELSHVAREAWNTTRTENATLELGASCSVECDPSLLQNLFENLFRNTVDHNDPPLTVRVGTLDRSEDGTAGFYVEDDGTGIPESEQKTVFEFGYTTSDSGTGLGLAIVREIVETHGWSVSVTEERSGGARIEVYCEPNRR